MITYIERIAGLVIFSSLREDPVLSALWNYYRAANGDDRISAACAYSEFAQRIISSGGDLSEYLLRTVLKDDNIYVRSYLEGNADLLEKQLRYELCFLTELTQTLPEEPVSSLSFPPVASSQIDLYAEYMAALPDLRRRGVGVFAESAMLKLTEEGQLVPVRCADGARLSELVGYERERRRIIENTKALLRGEGAANVLLYGDAGTGKSSTVKAIVNEFASEGLRLIEITPSLVGMIPRVMERIASEPLKFIIFIDDLTLTSDSEELTTLKSVLEGGSSARSSNSLIFVTSNHRHLVRQSTNDREGAEVSVHDTLQGITGLSSRFGITVTYIVPDRELYLDIVRHYLCDKGHTVTEEILASAEAFAVRRGGRTPRNAEQFSRLVLSGIDPIK